MKNCLSVLGLYRLWIWLYLCPGSLAVEDSAWWRRCGMLAFQFHLIAPTGPKDNAIKVKNLLWLEVMSLTDQRCLIFLCPPFSANNFFPVSLMAGNKTVTGSCNIVHCELCLIHRGLWRVWQSTNWVTLSLQTGVNKLNVAVTLCRTEVSTLLALCTEKINKWLYYDHKAAKYYTEWAKC